ncbi:MAG TPA: hypothetical protein PLM79_13475 [Syntrophobacteraceae bacterium]|nr:hypothetical protein [Syntrophobacteraceae bacterium]
MGHWPKVRLSECLQLINDTVPVQRDQEYPNFGIYSYARGLFRKRPIIGLESSATTLRRVRKGQFIYSRLFAFEGAYGIVGDEFDGFFVSNEYPTFICDEARLMPHYLLAYFSMKRVWEAVAKGSKGLGVRRQRVQPEEILANEIPLAPIHVQRSIVSRLETVVAKARAVVDRLDAIEADAERLLAIRFRESMARADWRAMGEVAPVVRRDVEIEPEQSYTELGVRSFYKGTFHRRTLPGSEFRWQKLFWVYRGDLIFSNIMAWEQAIAIAKPADHGCVGNHRMLTCLPSPDITTSDYLWYYFTTQEGFASIAAASPGTAARNKTLTSDSLMAIRVPVPLLSTQLSFNALQSKVAMMKAKHTSIRKDLDALLPTMLERVFHSERCSP